MKKNEKLHRLSACIEKASTISRKGANRACPVDRDAALICRRRLHNNTDVIPTPATTALFVHRSSDSQSGSTILLWIMSDIDSGVVEEEGRESSMSLSVLVLEAGAVDRVDILSATEDITSFDEVVSAGT
mmetsp:Transcript_26918/g.58853  ORF Transcript_26918/g.58853 Transcript_26918/m.58853 type:complete len:130 (-) Transcript_26918:1112-1501(-)